MDTGVVVDDAHIPNEILDFHRHKIAEREKVTGKKVNYGTLVQDIRSVSEGYLVGL